MSDDNPVERTPNSVKRTRSLSLPAENEDQVGDESQISTFSIDDEISCGICLGVLESPYTVIPCLHTFDKDCLAGWWKQNDTCPLCKVRATSGRHSFQLQAIVNHYDNKRPPRKRAKGSDENAPNDDRAELYPFGVAPPLPGANPGHQNDDENGEDFDDFDQDEEDQDEDEDEDEEDLLPGGRLVFPCPACRPGHPSGYICPHPIPEPTDAMKRTEKEDYFNGRREVVAPGRGQQRISFAEGLHTLPGAGLVFQNHEIAEINRACEDHLACHACNAYIPRHWPRGIESTCRLCSRATCMLFDPQECPRIWDQWLRLRTFNEAGHDLAVEGLWHHIAARYHHFEHNPVERNRFVAVIAANNGINSVVVELMTSAGHAAEAVGPFYCKRCVEGVATDKIEEWWDAKKAGGGLPAEVANLPKCWYGRECRTQRHNINHAQRFNHDCDPRPQPQAQAQPQPDPDPQQALPMPPPPAPQPQAPPQP